MLSDDALLEVFNQDGPEAAEAASRAILAENGARTVALRVLGAALLQLGRLGEALDVQSRLLTAPVTAGDLINYAVTLRRLGRLDEAIDALRDVLEFDPDNEIAPVNLGAALLSAGRLDEADAILSQALQRRPRDGDLFANRGGVRYAIGDVEGAERDYLTALGLGVRRPELVNGLGAVFIARDRLSEAEALLRRVIAAAPQYASAHTNLALCLSAAGRAEEALSPARRSLELDPLDLAAHSVLMMLGNYLPQWSSADGMAACRAFQVATQSITRLATPFRERAPDKPLRVGLVSGDLRSHPVGYFLVAVLEHARRDVSFHAYPTTNTHDALTTRIRASCEGWTPIGGLTDQQAAEQIRADRIDVLLDLAGHTAHNRLGVFAARAAPVQASWLGYSATTGLAEMDYFIGDETVAPTVEQARFVEALIALPASYLCYCPPDGALPVAPTPALAKGHVTFGCFNKLAKLNSGVIDAWSRILQDAPSAKLLLQTNQLADAGVASRVRAEFDARQVGDRILLRTASPRATYFSDFADVDIMLDPFPFPGGTTTFDALWMGVPTVTLEGDRFLARAGASFARTAGLSDWVASTVDDYVSFAVRKARDIDALQANRSALRERVRRTPLFDAGVFADGFTRMLKAIGR